MRPTILLFSALLAAPIAGWSQPEDWYERPLFPLAAADPKTVDLKPMLEAACPGQVFLRQDRRGPTMGCSKCPAGSGFFIDRDVLDGVSVTAVTLGHFTGPENEDVLLAVSGCEPHSNLWGGSYLLTRQSGRWRSLGYYSRLITEQCHKVRTRDAQEILFCSHFFTAQGFRERFLYVLDFRTPKKPDMKPLLKVENEMCECGQASEDRNLPVKQSVIESVTFADVNGDGQPDVSVVARTGRIRRTAAEYQACIKWSMGGGWKNPPPVRTPAYRIDYLLEGSRFVLSPQSAAAKKFFPESRF